MKIEDLDDETIREWFNAQLDNAANAGMVAESLDLDGSWPDHNPELEEAAVKALSDWLYRRQ